MKFILHDKDYVDINQLMARKGEPHIDQGSRGWWEWGENTEVTHLGYQTSRNEDFVFVFVDVLLSFFFFYHIVKYKDQLKTYQRHKYKIKTM